MTPVKKKTAKNIVDPVVDLRTKRNQLAERLTIAAQIEHDVMVQYLFAAAALKKGVSEGGVTYKQLEMMRGWATNIMMVARQEMEHLGSVCNLLTAIGEAPVLRRPAFPMSDSKFPLNQPSVLTAFSIETARRFVYYEMPNQLSPEHEAFLKSHDKGFDPAKYEGIYLLYMEIEKLFEDIHALDKNEPFIGPPSAQFYAGGNSLLGGGMARGLIFPQPGQAAPQPIYDISMSPITNLVSAKKVIRQIVDEGEGASIHSETSHFARFFKMYKELIEESGKDPKFKPARNVVSNPRVPDGTPPVKGVTYITNADTQKVMKVFDQAYNTMLLMLMRYFAHTNESNEDLIGLQNTVFFPMMTVGIRPLAEVLTQLPAHDSGSGMAGPAFFIPKSAQFLPHRESAWRIILGELQLLEAMAQEAMNIKSLSPEIRSRLSLTYENFARMSMNFKEAMNLRNTK